MRRRVLWIAKVNQPCKNRLRNYLKIGLLSRLLTVFLRCVRWIGLLFCLMEKLWKMVVLKNYSTAKRVFSKTCGSTKKVDSCDIRIIFEVIKEILNFSSGGERLISKKSPTK